MTKKNVILEKRVWNTKKDMWKDGITIEKVYEVSKERSDWRNNTRRDDSALKEETNVRHTTKVEVSLAFTEEAKVAFEDLSVPVYMTKLSVDYLKELILFKGQIPEKVQKAVQMDQLKKLLYEDPFNLFSSHVQMKYYNK